MITIIRSQSSEIKFCLSCVCYRKKIEEIGKMTSLSQEEIISNTKVVVQGLESLKSEHMQILNSLCNSLKTIKADAGNDTLLIEDKTALLKKSLDMIDLGMGEAEVGLSTTDIYVRFLAVFFQDSNVR